jgi:hypothetical protein
MCITANVQENVIFYTTKLFISAKHVSKLEISQI